MADVTKRNKANKRKGAQYETDLIAHLREQGYDADRLRLTGRKDEGDIAVRLPENRTAIIEAKNTTKADLAGFVSEADAEYRNYAAHRGYELSSVIPIVIMKRRNHAINKSYVVMSLDTLLRII